MHTVFVIRRTSDGMYAAPPGSKRSYTSDLAKARTFVHHDEAKRECCGNERVENIAAVLNLHNLPIL